MFIYVAITRPFKDRPLNVLNVLVELFIALSYSIMIFFCFDLTDEQENSVKWCAISLVICTLSVTVGYILFTFGVSIRDIFSKKTAESEDRPDSATKKIESPSKEFESKVYNEDIELVDQVSPSPKQSLSQDFILNE